MDDRQWQALRVAAEKARALAYAPYSQFLVGAAALFEGGHIASGCNVENCSYGLTLCAERNAICRGIAEGHRRLLAVALCAEGELPCTPCGMCRQTMAEFAEPQLPIRSFTPKGVQRDFTLAGLLPEAFSPKWLSTP